MNRFIATLWYNLCLFTSSCTTDNGTYATCKHTPYYCSSNHTTCRCFCFIFHFSFFQIKVIEKATTKNVFKIINGTTNPYLSSFTKQKNTIFFCWYRINIVVTWQKEFFGYFSILIC